MVLSRLINFLQKWPQFGEVGQRVGYGAATNQGLSLLRTTLESARAKLCQKSAFQKTTLENLATYTQISYHNTIFAKLLRLLVHSMSVRGQHVDLCW